MSAARRRSAPGPLAAAAFAAAALVSAPAPARPQVVGPRASASAAERAAPPRLTVGVLGYLFALDLPEAGDTIAGSATVAVRRLRAGAPDTLPLDLVGHTVDAVGGRRGARLVWAYDGRVLRVVLPPVGAPGPDTVRVAYHGRPADGLIIGANARGRRSVFADNWPDRARHFLPTVDHPAYKAPVTWEIAAPASMRVVANGVLAGVTERPGGRRVWTYVEARPIPTYTMVLGASTFSVSRHRASVVGADTVANEVWTYPEDSAFADAGPFRRATEIVDAGSRIIGPFPYAKLAHVQSSTRYGGMENSAAIFYAERPYVTREMREGVVRHETAHQWFGDAVTERDWRHLWLSEGFASYFDLVLEAALDGDSVLAPGMSGSARGYFASPDVKRPLVDSAAQDLMGLLNANSYDKGAWVLHMLRGELGDPAFFRGVRAYYRTYRDSSVVSEDFQRVMEREAGRDLGWFFRQWLYQAGYPQLSVTMRADSAAHRVTLRVRQTQPAAWGAFRLPRVGVRFLAGTEPVGSDSFALAPTAEEQVFVFDVSGPPTGLVVDPFVRLLMTSTVR